MVLFGRFPRGLFPPGVFFFLDSPSALLLSYPRGDCFPKKAYIPPREVLRGYYGTHASTVAYLQDKSSEAAEAAELLQSPRDFAPGHQSRCNRRT